MILMNRKDTLWVLRRCGRVGHQLAWLDDTELARTTEAVGPAGEPLLECLRCGTFVSPTGAAVTAIYGEPEDRASLAEVPLAVRGAHGRKLAVLKLVAAERAVRAVMLIMGAVIIFAAAANRDTVIAKTNALIESATPLASQIGWDIQHSHMLELGQHALGSSTTIYRLAGFALLAYAVLQLVEAWGLWGGRRWAEYLAVVATSVFLPLEFYEMAQHPTAFKAVTITVNIAIVIYLIFKGRLFGVRGGHTAWLNAIRSTTLIGEELIDTGRDPLLQASHQLV